MFLFRDAEALAGDWYSDVSAIEFFTVCTKLAEMAILYSKDLTRAKKSYLQWGSI